MPSSTSRFSLRLFTAVFVFSISALAGPILFAQPTQAQHGQSNQAVQNVVSRFEAGLQAITNDQYDRAFAIRSGFSDEAVEHKTLSWLLALTGRPEVSSGEIAMTIRRLAGWPEQAKMRENFEEALAREADTPQTLIGYFEGGMPRSLSGRIALARAYREIGDKGKANELIAPVWRSMRIDRQTEQVILDRLGDVLTKDDHRNRMHWLFYEGQATAANRLARYVDEGSLIQARTAVARGRSNAGTLLGKVEKRFQSDPSYLFDQAKRHRKSDRDREAAKWLARAPNEPALLINPDAWSLERQIVARGLLDLEEYQLAYETVAADQALSPSRIANAQFLAGWIALRYLKAPEKARPHFRRLIEVTSRPISQSRGHYWLGRTYQADAGREHYERAANFPGTFYGQLASHELKLERLIVSDPKPSQAARLRYAQNELVRSIRLLEKAGQEWRATSLYKHLARTLEDAGELAILTSQAVLSRGLPFALSIGKEAHYRGLEVDALAWPLGAIPAVADIGEAGRALAYAIARQESSFNTNAKSPANARGLLQILPGTAREVAQRKGLSYSAARLTQDPAYNATLGSAYLSQQLDRFDGSYILTLIGYNAGPSRSIAWMKRFGDPRGQDLHAVIDWIERIPFSETRNYVQRVMENYQIYKSRITDAPLSIASDLRFGRMAGQ